jgi:putative AlgH/UPF0301 family transcriptional regulator
MAHALRSTLRSFTTAVLLAALSWSAAAAPSDLDEPFMLVAKRQFQHQLYGHTVIVAKPLGGDRHVGFIVNRPTPFTLGAVYPDHEASKKADSTIFLGGPFNAEVVMAIVNRADSPGGKSMRLTPELYLAMEEKVIDTIIEKESGKARFLAGMVLWDAGELRQEVEAGVWYVRAPDANVLTRKSTEGMWEEVVARAEIAANGI